MSSPSSSYESLSIPLSLIRPVQPESESERGTANHDIPFPATEPTSPTSEHVATPDPPDRVEAIEKVAFIETHDDVETTNAERKRSGSSTPKEMDHPTETKSKIGKVQRSKQITLHVTNPASQKPQFQKSQAAAPARSRTTSNKPTPATSRRNSPVRLTTDHRTPPTKSQAAQLEEHILASMQSDGSQMDQDTAAFTDSVHKWTGMLERAIITDFMSARSSMLARQSQAFEGTRSSLVQKLDVVTKELNDTKAQIGKYQKTAKRSMELVEGVLEYLNQKVCTSAAEHRLSLALFISRNGTQRARAVQAIYFGRWRVKYADAARLRLAGKMADQHAGRALLRKTLIGWQRAGGVSWRRSIETQVRNEAERALAELAAEYDKQIASLQSQVSNLESELRESETARQSQQEDMKKAFMRGVCALNMEAMGMFRKGNFPGDMLCDQPRAPLRESNGRLAQERPENYNPVEIPTGKSQNMRPREASNSIPAQWEAVPNRMRSKPDVTYQPLGAYAGASRTPHASDLFATGKATGGTDSYLSTTIQPTDGLVTRHVI
ncbi:hypothetical protein BC832DRAFT_243780 [Gaertneriomyces semiglobifer]|nr:hypothetical protein BC832DRAFT_243780 [Gaertneriomyces semiglobifer]